MQEAAVQATIAVDATQKEHAMQDIAEIARQVVIANAEYWAIQHMVQRQLAKRFGPLEDDLIAQLERLPTERLELLAGDLLDFTARADLIAWLADHPIPVEDDDEDDEDDDAPADTGGAGI